MAMVMLAAMVLEGSINPFQRVKRGRWSWLDIKAKYAGVDKWEAEANIKDDFLH